MSVDDQFKRIDCSKIYQPLFHRYCDLLQACERRGKIYIAISGYRDPQDQQQLYLKGRSTESLQRGEKIVTYAKPLSSFHNFGMAVDFVLDTNVERRGLQPSWKLEDYKVLAEEAKGLGLNPAYYWKSFKEGPHVQMGDIELGLGHLRTLWKVSDSLGTFFELVDRFLSYRD